MAKQINFSYDNKDYTLRYTLKTVKDMENAGFVLDEIRTAPTVRIPELFYGAFFAEHRGIKRKLVDEIYEAMNGKETLIEALTDMYNEARNSLIDEGNLEWTMTE